jgi:hypothetical protein
MVALTEAQRRKQHMDDLLAAGAANGHSLMVLRMDDLAGLLQRLQGGVANGTQALSNSLHAQTTTIEAMAKQVRELLAENTRLNARLAELERQNLAVRQFDAQVQLQAKKLDHEAKTTEEMLGLIKIGAAAMLNRRGGGLGALGRLLGGGESEEDPSGATNVAKAPPAASMPSARTTTSPPPEPPVTATEVPVTVPALLRRGDEATDPPGGRSRPRGAGGQAARGLRAEPGGVRPARAPTALAFDAGAHAGVHREAEPGDQRGRSDRHAGASRLGMLRRHDAGPVPGGGRPGSAGAHDGPDAQVHGG